MAQRPLLQYYYYYCYYYYYLLTKEIQIVWKCTLHWPVVIIALKWKY